MDEYDDLTGEYVTDKGVTTRGAASMTTQVFKEGGLKKICDEAHLRGFREGFQEGFDAGFAEKVEGLIDAALERRMVV